MDDMEFKMYLVHQLQLHMHKTNTTMPMLARLAGVHMKVAQRFMNPRDLGNSIGTMLELFRVVGCELKVEVHKTNTLSSEPQTHAQLVAPPFAAPVVDIIPLEAAAQMTPAVSKYPTVYDANGKRRRMTPGEKAAYDAKLGNNDA